MARAVLYGGGHLCVYGVRAGVPAGERGVPACEEAGAREGRDDDGEDEDLHSGDEEHDEDALAAHALCVLPDDRCVFASSNIDSSD